MNRVAECSLALIGLFLFVSLAANFGGFGEWFKLVVQAPYMALLFYGFYRVLSKDASREGWKRAVLDILLLFSLMLFFVGYGLHFAANHVEVKMAEDKLMLLLAPKVATSLEALVYLSAIYSPTYYFDEILGHQLVYTGFFGLMVGGILLEAWYKEEEKLEVADYAAIAASSVMLTLIMTMATVEGQYAIHALILSSVMVLALVARFRKGVVRRPFILLMLLTGIMTASYILVLAAIYFDPISVALHGLTGRVPQPSEPSRILCQFIFLSGAFSDETKILLAFLI
ncbi:MAG: hypothetical protein KIH01_00355 [Candidatus Freyarchaeota archaeon]|nr:hypothetical protein [Candidatus Jordarchaeia archaeon]